MIKYSQTQTESFYDKEDSVYRSFWDKEGSLHWGYFEDFNETDFIVASNRWNNIMLERIGIDKNSKVLDLGCGNGNSSIWLARQTGCSVIGIDISQARINNAMKKAKKVDHLNVTFTKATATKLPFESESFTHVWSQAVLYHVPERKQALKEINRVLKEEGTLVFDDLLQPSANISADTQKYVYDRLLISHIWSDSIYCDMLNESGFTLIERENLSRHLHRNYELLQDKLPEAKQELKHAYQQMCLAIERNEMGWGFFICDKITNHLDWIYREDTKRTLEQKYNAWALTYDQELDVSYKNCPQSAAKKLQEYSKDKSAAILDAGAGTGMVGEALYKMGYTNLTGADISEGMLRVARKKAIYRKCLKVNLESDTALFKNNTFDAIICTGVFTFGHVKPEAMNNLNRWLKKEGYLVVTFRQDYINKNKILKQVLDKLPWTIVDQSEFNIFDQEPMTLLVFKKHN